jgi:hypothetical protein
MATWLRDEEAHRKLAEAATRQRVARMSGIPGEHDTYLCQLISDVPQLVCYHEQGM